MGKYSLCSREAPFSSSASPHSRDLLAVLRRNTPVKFITDNNNNQTREKSRKLSSVPRSL